MNLRRSARSDHATGLAAQCSCGELRWIPALCHRKLPQVKLFQKKRDLDRGCSFALRGIKIAAPWNLLATPVKSYAPERTAQASGCTQLVCCNCPTAQFAELTDERGVGSWLVVECQRALDLDDAQHTTRLR